MSQIDSSNPCKLLVSCLLQDKQKLVDLLLTQQVDQFDLWHGQRYGKVNAQLTLIEQVRGCIDICIVSVLLPHQDALSLKQVLSHHLPNVDCTLLPLLATH
ncbi:MAG: DUF3240 family protein [Thiotrichales bacterium]|jgi:predicted nucleic acid-binding protein|nr:DUF3240 family protein [Pseudomonadota bacterium]MCI4412037.1 DUF3240 family protein [Thiotrichales bacterium]